jgi:hypothetical protein
VLANTRRRIIAACASVLLLLGLVAFTASPSQADDPVLWTARGTLVLPDSSTHVYDASPVSVRFYRATGDIGAPWELATTVHVNLADGGAYEAHLQLGSYRITINELDDGSPAWDAWEPMDWVDQLNHDAPEFTFDGVHDANLWQTRLAFRGGLISGKVTDQCGSDVHWPKFEMYDADLDGTTSSYTIEGEYDGTYEIHGLVGPTKLRVSTNPYGGTWIPGWYPAATSFADATTVSVDPGHVTTGHDLVLRRALDLTPGKTQVIYGVIKGPDGKGIVGLTVKYYRATGDPDEPFLVEKTSTTQPSNNGRSAGAFAADVPPGEYHLTVNESDDGTTTSHGWGSLQSPSATIAEKYVHCVDSGHNYDLGTATIGYAGGSINGRVTDARGKPVSGATVEAYDGSATEATSTPINTTKSGADGRYTIHAMAGPTKLRFYKTDFNVAEWFNDAPTFSAATNLTVPVNGESEDNDVVLADAQMHSTRRVDIRHPAFYGSRVSRASGRWAPYPVKLSYQWIRKSGSTLTPITGERSTSYTVREKDLGKRLILRETATVVGNYPGVVPATQDSEYTERVKRGSTGKVSAKYSSGHLRLRVRIKTKGVSHPKGRVTFTAQRYRWDGNSYVRSGGGHRSTVTFRDGKASVAFKGARGSWRYEANYDGSSTASGAYDDGFTFFH